MFVFCQQEHIQRNVLQHEFAQSFCRFNAPRTIYIVIIRGNVQQDISHLVRSDKVKGVAFLQPFRKNGDHPFQLLFFLFCVDHDKYLLYVFDPPQIIAYKIFFLSCAEKVEAAPIF